MNHGDVAAAVRFLFRLDMERVTPRTVIEALGLDPASGPDLVFVALVLAFD